MIHFVGAGPGAEDLITVRGQRYLEQADVVIYAGSLVNPGLLKSTKETCEIYNSAKMTLEEVLEVMEQAEREQKMTVRLHTGDPVCTVQSGNRWIIWMNWELRMIPARVSVPSAGQQRH